MHRLKIDNIHIILQSGHRGLLGNMYVFISSVLSNPPSFLLVRPSTDQITFFQKMLLESKFTFIHMYAVHEGERVQTEG